MDFVALREQYKEFLYKGFCCEAEEGAYKVTYSYEISGLSDFETVWRFPDAGRAVNKEILNRLFFELGMAEAVSYWKCACPKVLKVECGTLTAWQKRWWRKLFYNGLGEFMYRNGIEVSEEELLTIVCEEAPVEKLPDNGVYKGCLVPVGGGKDSVVSMEVLKDRDVTVYRINKDATVANVLEASGRNYRTCFVNRKLDARILEMNRRGLLNGHIPFSSVVAFSTYIAAYLQGIRYIALSNESSANESTVVGSFVNHQYSKSYEFEQDFMEYIGSIMEPKIRYFSLLRPLSELQIAFLFSGYERYHRAFRSCNAGSKQGIWCCNCPKCLFVYIILSPFLSEERLVEIFGDNLLDAERNEKYFRELTGLDENKPFECVGTRREVILSLKTYLKSGGTALLPKKYSEWILAQEGDMDEALAEWNDKNSVPEELLTVVRKELADRSGVWIS
ncbi:MAG: hypothetical protein PUC73_05800 [Lachnospiraceae bacterium]|nr:hypothetical protein [Lachnospiraceae bacterium]